MSCGALPLVGDVPRVDRFARAFGEIAYGQLLQHGGETRRKSICPLPVFRSLNWANIEQLEELWFLLHGSSDPYRRMTATATCYLDDSGEQGKTVILGGCVLHKESFYSSRTSNGQRCCLPILLCWIEEISETEEVMGL
jgi:hypothetical protein